MPRVAVLLALIVLAACSPPPQKEIDQAQGALDAARAAGAAEYAKDEYTAAVSALQKAHDAVEQRDYRLALSYALDARERSQDAARAAADGKAAARSKAEARIATVTAHVQQLETKIETEAAAHTSARRLRAPRATLTALKTALQEAGTALARESFDAAVTRLDGADAQADAAIASLEATPRPVRRRRH